MGEGCLPCGDLPRRSTAWFHTTQGSTKSGRNLTPPRVKGKQRRVERQGCLPAILGLTQAQHDVVPDHPGSYKLWKEPQPGLLCNIHQHKVPRRHCTRQLSCQTQQHRSRAAREASISRPQQCYTTQGDTISGRNLTLASCAASTAPDRPLALQQATRRMLPRHHMCMGLSQRHVAATLALQTDIVCDTEIFSWQNKAFRWY